MKNKQIQNLLNTQQTLTDSKKTLEIMRQNTNYPTTRKFNSITFIFVNVILVLVLTYAFDSGKDEAIGMAVFACIIGSIVNLLAREAINMVTDIADSSVTQVQILQKLQSKSQREI